MFPFSVLIFHEQFIDPKESGAVIPILHLKSVLAFYPRRRFTNIILYSGYKISERTLPGTMDDLELVTLFTGYGYQVRFVEYGNLPQSTEEIQEKTLALNKSMAVSMEWAYQEIRHVHPDFRTIKRMASNRIWSNLQEDPNCSPQWEAHHETPMACYYYAHTQGPRVSAALLELPLSDLAVLQGMTGPARVDNQTMVGSFHAHQVPLPRAKSDDEQLAALQTWLSSYDVHELFVDQSGSATPNPADPGALFSPDVLRILPPREDRRLGMTKETYDGYEPLDVPDFQDFVTEKADRFISPMKAIGGA